MTRKERFKGGIRVLLGAAPRTRYIAYISGPQLKMSGGALDALNTACLFVCNDYQPTITYEMETAHKYENGSKTVGLFVCSEIIRRPLRSGRTLRARHPRQLRYFRHAATPVAGPLPLRVHGPAWPRAFRSLSHERAFGVRQLRGSCQTGGRPLRVVGCGIRVRRSQLRRPARRVVRGPVPGIGRVPGGPGHDGTAVRDRGRYAGHRPIPYRRRARAIPAA